MQKTAIITGISGQDGSYLAKLLIKKNIFCVGVVRNTKKIQKLPGLEFLNIISKIKLVKCNLENLKQTNELIKKFKPDYFFNLAAQSSVGFSFKMPLETIKFNTISVVNILESIRLFNSKTRYYQASSSEIYGNLSVQNLPVDIFTKTNAISPYGISKELGYKYVKLYRETYGIYCVNGILFNHESCLRKDGFIINKAINHALQIKSGAKKKLIVGDVSVVRDWGYAPKYVEAMYKILLNDYPKDLIICSGKSIKLIDFLRNIYSCLKLNIDEFIEIDKSLFRSNELKEIFGCNKLAKKTIGWEYKMTNHELSEQLISDYLTYYNWIKNRY